MALLEALAPELCPLPALLPEVCPLLLVPLLS
jgi:hypothetical protein